MDIDDDSEYTIANNDEKYIKDKYETLYDDIHKYIRNKYYNILQRDNFGDFIIFLDSNGKELNQSINDKFWDEDENEDVIIQ